MKAFRMHKGLVMPLDRSNVDTDQIIPKQFLKRIERTGFGQYLFYDWRFRLDGSEDAGFVTNLPQYHGASILLAGPNFGSGSSREHAVWALMDFGIRVVVAPSFADIFYNNCAKNGLLPVVLPIATVTELIQRSLLEENYQLSVSLEDCIVGDDQGLSSPFKIDPFRRHCLLQGLDDIALTLEHQSLIETFEAKRPAYLS